MPLFRECRVILPLGKKNPMHRFFAGVALTALFATASYAQTASARDTIRVEQRSGAVMEGVLISRDTSWFEVRPLDGQAATRIALSEIAAAEVRRGTRTRGWRAVGIGLLTGAAIGSVGGFAIGDRGTGDLIPSRGQYAQLLSVIGAMAGAVVGVIFATTSVTNWVPFSPYELATGPMDASPAEVMGVGPGASPVR